MREEVLRVWTPINNSNLNIIFSHKQAYCNIYTGNIQYNTGMYFVSRLLRRRHSEFVSVPISRLHYVYRDN